MNWIENWQQVSPDGGDGSLELLVLLVVATGTAALLVAFSRRARSLIRRVIAPAVTEASTVHRP